MVEAAANSRERLRRFRAANPGWSTAKNAQWQAANPEKRAAHKRVEVALRNGTLVRLSCERCGDVRSQAHHDDYSKPLEVMWLCQLHHRERHRELESLAGGVMPDTSPKLAGGSVSADPPAFSRVSDLKLSNASMAEPPYPTVMDEETGRA